MDVPPEADAAGTTDASENVQLRRALSRLDPEELRVIRALYVERLSMREAARVLHVPEKRIARRAAQAMQVLGTAMLAVP